jgi:hypothetical protein
VGPFSPRSQCTDHQDLAHPSCPHEPLTAGLAEDDRAGKHPRTSLAVAGFAKSSHGFARMVPVMPSVL